MGLVTFCVLPLNVFGVNSLRHVDSTASPRPAITVTDMIAMTEPGTLGFGYDFPVAQFSPDGTKVAVVLRRGNAQQNTNEYSILLWITRDLSTSETPQVIVTLASSSNRPGIQYVKWLSDNRTIVFLGERPGETQQLYSLDIITHRLTRLTNHSTSLRSYSVTPDCSTIIYSAEAPVSSLFDSRAQRDGVVVTSQFLSALIRVEGGGRYFGDDELFWQSGANDAPKGIRLSSSVSHLRDAVVVSPDGHHAAIRTYVSKVPELWKEYSDPEMRSLTHKPIGPGQHSFLTTYLVVDLKNGTAAPLLDAPLSGNNDSRLEWSPDSTSVVVTDTYLPLDGSAGSEKITRESTTFAVEVAVNSGAITPISSAEMQIHSWEASPNRLIFESGRRLSPSPRKPMVFERKSGAWHQVSEGVSATNHPLITVDEDMNTPPALYLHDAHTGEKTLLLDLNPQLKSRQLAKVEEIQWKATDGHSVHGGLYYPIHYESGKRYPLVIQNHGFDKGEFAMGPGHSAFVAQPLAGNDIFALQIAWSTDGHDVPHEAQLETAAYEGAIDYLDGRGLIERKKVGIGAFSRTGIHVKYALTHSGYDFVAATICDDTDGGYFQYLVNMNSYVGFAKDFEQLNGAVPFGEGLLSWLKRSPGFNIDKVHTPVRILALSPETLLYEWEWFAALYKLAKPVDMIYIPDGQHELQKPWDRIIAQEGNLDWFLFWLKREEDPDPAKADQYARWRELRKLQEKQSTD